jgi:hypothetical protein
MTGTYVIDWRMLVARTLHDALPSAPSQAEVAKFLKGTQSTAAQPVNTVASAPPVNRTANTGKR